jgi:signal transduction histidine kinase
MPFFAATMTLSELNGSFSDPFLFFAPIMVLGYSTVGAVVASRQPRNPIGWLLMVAGISFLLAGFSEEYVTYTYESDPGALPLGALVAWVSQWVWSFVSGSVLLILALFPTGRVHSSGWRFLPPTIVTLTAVLVLGAMFRPGPLDLAPPIRIQNPTGIEALRPLLGGTVETVLGILLVVAALASLAASVHRYRRARGEERQQVRLFAVAAMVGGFLLVATSVTAALFEESPISDALFLAFFAVVGLGVPLAVGVAMLRYRLFEVDVVIRKTVVFVILASLLTIVFLLLAGAFGAIVGIVADPRGATLALAAAFGLGILTVPLWRVSRRIADRVVFGGRQTPYEVLAGFAHRVSDTFATEDVLPRMAGVLQAATGALRAVVWLRVGNDLRPAGASREDPVVEPVTMSGDSLPFAEAEHAFEVRHQGELLGALSVELPTSDPMNPSKARLIQDLARQAGPVLRNVRLIEELRASRQRLVTAQDEERRRLERNIHDGAQQQLVALAVKMRLAEGLTRKDPARAAELMAQVRTETQAALEDLRDLARGIYPPLLADKGLAAALEAQARRAALPVLVESNGLGRYSPDAEATAYFCVLEALQNVAKYAEATSASVRFAREDHHLVFSVSDDGKGFDPESTPRGTGLQNMADRLEALGGSLSVESSPGRGTIIAGRIPAVRRDPSI